MLRAVAASTNGQVLLNFYLLDCATDEASEATPVMFFDNLNPD